MNFENRDADSIGPLLLSASTLMDNEVYNLKEEQLGDIKEFMLDTNSGKICYAVLSFGGFLGMGEKLFAVPWSSLKLDIENKRFLLDMEVDRLKSAPGFDNDRWPDMTDVSWARDINDYYGVKQDRPSNTGSYM